MSNYQKPLKWGTRCGKPAAPFIPRRGEWLSCVLAPDHEGPCQPGGDCFKHGEYIGLHCDKCPPLLIAGASSLEREAAASVALEWGTYRSCNNPECSNPWPCALHPDQSPDDKMPCGHRRANEVGDEGGTPYCEVCEAERKNVFANCRALGERIVQMLRQGMVDKFGFEHTLEIILFMVHNKDPLRQRLAKAKLEEFDYLTANRPVDPTYFDKHHRKELEDEAK